jgi:hypothetical protein
MVNGKPVLTGESVILHNNAVVEFSSLRFSHVVPGSRTSYFSRPFGSFSNLNQWGRQSVRLSIQSSDLAPPPWFRGVGGTLAYGRGGVWSQFGRETNILVPTLGIVQSVYGGIVFFLKVHHTQ